MRFTTSWWRCGKLLRWTHLSHYKYKLPTEKTFVSLFENKSIRLTCRSLGLAGIRHFSTHQKEQTSTRSWARMALDFIQSSPICKAALLTAGYQFFFFLPSALLRIDKLTDLAGASNFAVLGLWSYFSYSSFSARQRWLTSLVVMWSSRLALFLGYRIWFLFGEDKRLDKYERITVLCCLSYYS